MLFRKKFSLKRYRKNPIIKPRPNVSWERRAAFNPGVIYVGGKFHIIYRAMSNKRESIFGYATSQDGFHIDEHPRDPIYVPRKSFEKRRKNADQPNSGCEDARLTRLGDRIYMFYTAYDGKNPPSGAITYIELDDFLNKKWNWASPRLCSPLKGENKDICIFPEKIKNKYLVIHRTGVTIDYYYADDLYYPLKNLKAGHEGEGKDWINPRKGKWDNKKVGANGPPIKTKYGWLLFYHGVSDKLIYRLGAVLLSLRKPENIIARTKDPIFEPKKKYEKKGQVPNVVFSCGTVLLGDTLYVYYGGADTVIGLATCSLEKLIKEIKK